MTRQLLAAIEVKDDAELAEALCRACIEHVEVDGAALSLLTATPLRGTFFASDSTANLLEDLQFTLGEGPCVDAATLGRPVLVPDLADPDEAARWPAYVEEAQERAEIRSVFAFPLQWATTNLAVLDLYRNRPGSLTRAELRDVTGAADTAALMLLGLRTAPPGSAGDTAWDRTWGSRAEIHQATGILVAQLELSATDAFARLRARAFVERRLVTEVAHDVVAKKLRFEKD